MSALPYRPEIDGLRAIAVIPVVLFHLGCRWIDGGYQGVDVFFVISGYLITGIIVKDFDEGRFTYQRFWARRVRRILPALAVMLVATLTAVCIISFRGDSRTMAAQGAAAIFSVANILFWRTAGNYWGTAANESPFLHTWSLSVEEQFYLAYPFLLVWLLKHARSRMTLVLLFVAIASFALSVVGMRYKPEATFYLLPTRAWELACGCLLALRVPSSTPRRPTIESALAITGLAAVVTSFFVFSSERGFPGQLAIPVVGTVFAIAFSRRENVSGRLLSLRPFVFIGRISYSLYLWHWPIIVLGGQLRQLGYAVTTPVLLATILLMSWLSFRFVETPTRIAKWNSTSFRLIGGAVLASVLLCLHLETRPMQYDIRRYQTVVWEGSAYYSAPIDGWETWDQDLRAGIVAAPVDSHAADAYLSGGIIRPYGADMPEIVVLGDSHALMWAGTIDRVAREQHVTVSFLAAYGTSPFINIATLQSDKSPYFTTEQKRDYDERRLHYLRLWRPKVAVLATRWSTRSGTGPEELIEFLEGLGSQILLIEQPPELSFSNKNVLQYLAYLGLNPKRDERQYVGKSSSNHVDLGRAFVRDLCLRHPSCHLVETTDIYQSRDDRVWVLDDDKLIYFDDDHLTQSGAEQAKQRLDDAIRSILRPEAASLSTRHE